MAVILIKRYDLLDLKVTIDTSGLKPAVVCCLEATRKGKTQRLSGWSFSPAAFGLPETIDPRQARSGDYSFRLPDRFGEQLSTFLVQDAPVDEDSFLPDGPLWLYLARPYGYLGLLPWERLLRPFVRVPILRLPDFVVEPPRETPKTLDVLLWTSMPAAKEEFDLMGYLGMVLRRVPAAVPRAVTFHVFTDALFYPELRQRWQADQLLGERVQLYDPADAERLTAPPDHSGSLDNPWFLWMHQALKGRSVDVVHFIGHGYFTRDWPALAIAQSPVRNTNVQQARFVGPAQLNTFLTRIGAWAFACSSPEHNYSELGLRHLADTLAQLRPGAVLFHDLSGDVAGTDLAAAYKFLFSSPPQWPPTSPNLFLYCQPYHVSRNQTGRRARAGDLVEQQSVSRGFALDPPPKPEAPVLEMFKVEQNVPVWLAATQRYVEQLNWRLGQWEREEAEEGSSGRRREQIKGVRGALEQIQQLVAEVLKGGGVP
jgi:hypothetical protein